MGSRSGLATPVAWTDRNVARPRDEPVGLDLFQWFEAAWVAVAMLALLFPYQLGQKGVLLSLSVVPIYAVVRYRTIPQLLVTILPILALPIWAMLSALWSKVPGTTLYYGSTYLATVLTGAIIGAGTDRRQCLLGLFAAFGFFTVVSFVFGGTADWGGGGASRITTAFIGIGGSKNSSADCAAIGILVAITFLMYALRERRPIEALAAFGVTALNVWIEHNSHSTGSLAGVLLAVVVLLVLILGRVFSVTTRTALFVVTLIFVAVAAALQKLWLHPLVSLLLSASGKDETLTGRTYIWDRGFHLIAAHPWMGLGYAAFWRQDNIDARGIWAYAGEGLQGPFNFNFHNTFIEILVHFGYVGLALFGIVTISTAVILVVRTVRFPTDLGVFFCSYFAYVAFRLSIETQAVGPFSYGTALTMAALASALWRPRVAGADEPKRSKPRSRVWKTAQIR